MCSESVVLSFEARERMKILVVDDSKTTCLFIKSILESYNHEIEFASHGLDALAKIAQSVPDLVIMDVVMPEMDGYETCKFITSNPDTSHIPVVILTCLDKTDDLVKAFSAGAMDFIRKPPNELELIARVNSALRIKQYQDKLNEMIITDGLTGLYTHSYFITVLEREFHSARRYKLDLGLILFDIDDFKTVNDTYGHIAGDKVLCNVSNIFMENIRKTDIASRYGGEEFGMVAPHSNVEVTYQVAERLRTMIEQTSVVERDYRISTAISAGVTLINAKDKDCTDMIRRADDALYEAKKMGKNRTIVKI